MKVAYGENSGSIYNEAYKKLFDKAQTKIREIAATHPDFEGKDPNSINITNLVGYYKYLDYLIDAKYYSFLRVPFEEYIFEIDTTTRKINPKPLGVYEDLLFDSSKNSSFNNWTVGVKDDHMAEVIFFKVNRYYDGQDLGICFPNSNEKIGNRGQTYIQWKNNAYVGLDAVTYVEISEDTIYFGWPLGSGRGDSNIEGPLSVSGKLEFSIRFQYQENVNKEDGTPDLDGKTLFSLNTLPYEFTVAKNLTELMSTDEDFTIGNALVENVADQLVNRPRFAQIINNATAERPIILVALPAWQNLDANGQRKLEIAASLNTEDAVLGYSWFVDGAIAPGDADKKTYIAEKTGHYKVKIYNSTDQLNSNPNESTCIIPTASNINFSRTITEDEDGNKTIKRVIHNGTKVLSADVEIEKYGVRSNAGIVTPQDLAALRLGNLTAEWYCFPRGTSESEIRLAFENKQANTYKVIANPGMSNITLNEAGEINTCSLTLDFDAEEKDYPEGIYVLKVINTHNKDSVSINTLYLPNEESIERASDLVEMCAPPQVIEQSNFKVSYDENTGKVTATFADGITRFDMYYKWSLPDGTDTPWILNGNSVDYITKGAYECWVIQSMSTDPASLLDDRGTFYRLEGVSEYEIASESTSVKPTINITQN